MNVVSTAEYLEAWQPLEVMLSRGIELACVPGGDRDLLRNHEQPGDPSYPFLHGSLSCFSPPLTWTGTP